MANKAKDSRISSGAAENALAVAETVLAALAGAAVVDSGAGDEINAWNPLIFFAKLDHKPNTKGEDMKKVLTVTSIVGIGAVLALMTACQTTGTTGSVVAQKEALLAQSGFKVITVTTPKQQQAVNGLAQGRVSAVKFNGKLYYVFPTGTKDKIYVGKQKQFNAYKQALMAQQPTQASPQGQPGQQLMNPAPTMTYEGAGPHHVEVEQFDGFGPMGTASLGDW